MGAQQKAWSKLCERKCGRKRLDGVYGRQLSQLVQDQLQGFCDTVSKTSTETRVIAGTGLLLGVVAGAVVFSQSTTIGSLQLKNASLKTEVSSIQSQVRWKR